MQQYRCRQLTYFSPGVPTTHIVTTQHTDNCILTLTNNHDPSPPSSDRTSSGPRHLLPHRQIHIDMNRLGLEIILDALDPTLPPITGLLEASERRLGACLQTHVS